MPLSTQHTETSALHTPSMLNATMSLHSRWTQGSEPARSVLPSGSTILGLVQHLTLNVGRFWFSAVAAATKMRSIDSPKVMRSGR